MVLATFATVLSSTAHAVGSGQIPTELIAATPLAALAAAGVLSTTAVGVLGWQRRPWWLVALALTAVQAGQHLALLTANAPTVTSAALSGHAHAGHRPAVDAAGVLGSSLSLTHSAGTSFGHSGHRPMLMLAGHAVAAVLTAALLGYGESVVRLLLTWLTWPAPLLLRHRQPIASRRAIPVGVPVARLNPARLVGGVGLRGPPARGVTS